MSSSKSTSFLTAESLEGPEIRIPVATVQGDHDGPTMLVVAGVHGSEYVGLESVRRLYHSIDPADLSGRLITVPTFGLPAFYGFATHINPIDGLNPGREFPGDPGGTFTQRAAHLVWTELVEQSDAVVDVHGGDLEEELTEYVQVNLTGDDTVDEQSLRLARAFGIELFVTSPAPAERPSSGNLFAMAAWHGKAGVLTEAGSHGILDMDLVEWYHDRLVDGLKGYGMLPGDPAEVEHRRLHRFGGAFAPTEGCWYPSVLKGETIAAGQRIGEMRDVFGEHICDVHSDDDAVVLGVMTIPARPEGSMLLGYATVAP
jgi:predicted deacylase